MFLIFGIGILAILGLMVIKQKNILLIYFFAALGFAIVAYNFNPIEGNDLHSYFWELSMMKDITWEEALARDHWKAYPVAKFYLYNIARFNDVHLLPGITVFISSMLFSLTLRKYCKKFNVSKSREVLAYTYFLCCFNFFYLASNIRNLLAVAVFLYFLYIDLVEEKNKVICIAVYIATILIHSAMVVFVMLRMVVFIKNRKLMFAALAVCLSYTLFQEEIFTFLGETFNNDFINSLVERASDSMNMSYRAIFDSMRCLVTQVFQVIIMYIGYKNAEKHTYKRNFYRYAMILCIFTLFSYIDYWIFMRLTLASAMIVPIPLADEFNYIFKRNKFMNAFTYIICIMNIIYMFNFQYRYF